MARKHCGTATPLGLWAFGVTAVTAMMAAIDITIVGSFLTTMVWFGGYTQMLCGVIELYREDHFHGTLFVAYGCMWLSISGGSGSQVFHTCWAIFTFFFVVMALRRHFAACVMLTGLMLSHWTLAYTKNDFHAHRAGYWIGFFTGCGSCFGGFGYLLKAELDFTIPTFGPFPDWFPAPWWPRKKCNAGMGIDRFDNQTSYDSAKREAVKKKQSFGSDGDCLTSFWSTTTDTVVLEDTHQQPQPSNLPASPSQTPTPAPSPMPAGVMAV